MPIPLVSVIVPTKNSSATLAECLDSIKKQSYPRIEIVVVDNFSTDLTPDITKRYTKLLFSQGPERSAQRNYGIEKASGDYVAIIDSDMNLSPSVIQDCVDTIESTPDAKGVIIPEESFGIGFWARCKQLERSFYVGVDYMEAARFFKRDTVRRVGGYDLDMVSGEDWDLSQRIEGLGKIVRISSFIYHNEGSISLLKTIRKKFYYAQLFAVYRNKNKKSDKISRQTGILTRYKLFLSHPKKLFKNPLVGIGMLFMKTCEFSFGAAGYIKATLSTHDK